MERLLGIGLAAGCGVRSRPLTLKAHGYLRAKAAMHFLGRRVLDWVMHDLHQQGVHEFVMVTRGKENRYQVKNIIGYGEGLGADVRYSPVRYDEMNRGSGDALLTNMEYFRLDGSAVVFPTDSIFDVDLAALHEAHMHSGAVVTVASMPQPAEVIAGRYGLLDRQPNGRVRGFLEKPSLEAIYAHYGLHTPQQQRQLEPLATSAGLYLMNTFAMRKIARHPDLVAMRRKQCDIGADLLPWLVTNGYPVFASHLDRMGDLGNIPGFLHTMHDALYGRFLSMTPQMAPSLSRKNNVMIDPTTLKLADPISRLTLAEKIEQGLVGIHGPVRIGKYVQVFPGAVLAECNIDDDCEIYEHATIIRSSVGAGSLIGPHSYLEDAVTGSMVELKSTLKERVALKQFTAIGDEVVVEGGVTLVDNICIYPRLTVPAEAVIPAHAEVMNALQMGEYCRESYEELETMDYTPFFPTLPIELPRGHIVALAPSKTLAGIGV